MKKRLLSIFLTFLIACSSTSYAFDYTENGEINNAALDDIYTAEPTEYDFSSHDEMFYDSADEIYTSEGDDLMGQDTEPKFSDSRVIVKVSDVPVSYAAETEETFFGVEVENVETLSYTASDAVYAAADSAEPHDDGIIILLTLKESGEDKVYSAIETLQENPAVLYAEPDYIVKTEAVPNDTYYSMLYGMEKISAPAAWDITTGSRDVVVGIIDSGIDYNHEDLKDNMWVNPGEIPDNGIDDDGNGYIDDIYGWNFADNTNDPMDDHYHGTHVASTVGGVGNNGIGVTGVCQNVSLMALKAIDSGGKGYNSDIIKAVEYAGKMGVTITNNSYSGGGYDKALRDVIAKYRNCLFVAAAGNDETSNEISPVYPASYDCNNIISVGASDSFDKRASFSNYGERAIDIFAPGVDIYGAIPGGAYQTLSGTSMATPHVAGAAALVKSLYPEYSSEELKEAILQHCDQIPSLSRCAKYGARLNVAHALEKVAYSSIEKITLNAETVTIKTRERIKLNAVTEPFVVMNKNVKWMSSDETIVTVDDDGAVQAMGKEGTAVITAAAVGDESKTALCSVTVSGESHEVGIKDIGFKNKVIEALQNIGDISENYPLHDVAYFKNYSTNSIIYDTDVEKLYKLKLRTPIGWGEGITDMSGIEYFVNLIYLDCTNNLITLLDISALDKLEYFKCANNSITELKLNPDAPFATIDISNNYLDISPATELGQVLEIIKRHSNSCVVTPQNVPIQITGIEIEGGDLVMKQRDARVLNATVTPVDVSTMGVIWESSNPEVATVNSKGTLVAVSEGNTVITAASAVNSSFSASISITVSEETAEPVQFSRSYFRSSVIRALESLSSDYEGYEESTPLYPDDLNRILKFEIVGRDADDSDLSKLSSVEQLNLWNGAGARELDLRALTNLSDLTINNGYPVDKVDVSGLKRLSWLVISTGSCTTSLYELNAEGCINLGRLALIGFDFDTVNLSEFTKLQSLDLEDGRIKELDLTGLNKVQYFNCENNQIETLDLTPMSSLEKFYGSYNQMTELIVPEGHSYKRFECHNNYFDTSPDSRFMRDIKKVAENSQGGDNSCIYLPQNIKEIVPIELSYSFLEMSSGESFALTAKCSSLLGENPSLIWNSSNTDAVKVDDNGNMNAVSSGTAYITVCLEDNPEISAKSLVKVFLPETDGDGSSENPYILRTKEDILFLSGITTSGKLKIREKYLNADYILMPENGEYIDMEKVEFLPIGYAKKGSAGDGCYAGTFNGNDKEIRNLSINMTFNTCMPYRMRVGLFSLLSRAHIKDLAITNAEINVRALYDDNTDYGSACIGILAGESGEFFGDTASRVENIVVTGTINEEDTKCVIGGLIGLAYGYINSCAADVDINAPDSNRVGGLVGQAINDSSLYGCYSIGNILGKDYVGGIAGWAVMLYKCYSMGSVTGENYVGGICGYLNDYEKYFSGHNYVRNCLSGAEVNGKSNVGGIIGFVENTEIKNSAYTLAGQAVNGADNDFGEPLMFEKLYNKVFFKNLLYGYYFYDINEINYNPKIFKYNYQKSTYTTELVKHQPNARITKEWIDVNKISIEPMYGWTINSYTYESSIWLLYEYVVINMTAPNYPESVYALAAKYNGDYLTDSEIQYINWNPNKSHIYDLRLRDKELRPKDGEVLKIMLWDKNFSPVAEPFIISAD